MLKQARDCAAISLLSGVLSGVVFMGLFQQIAEKNFVISIPIGVVLLFGMIIFAVSAIANAAEIDEDFDIQKKFKYHSGAVASRKPVLNHLFKDPYVRMDFSDYTIQVKLDDEGVVVDVFGGNDESNGPIESTWKLYSEMVNGVDIIDGDEPAHNLIAKLKGHAEDVINGIQPTSSLEDVVAEARKFLGEN